MADPLKELLALKERMNRLFENALARSNFEKDPTRLGEWTPSVDVFETAENLVLQAELPGLVEQEIDVTIVNHTISISGDRAMGKEMQEGTYHRIERSYGSFNIEFPLGSPIAPDRVRATYHLGVLEVTLPKVGRERSLPLKVKLN